MPTKIDNKPIVMCFSGLDPSGGAGIQADIETLSMLGCHCTPIITSITVQDSRNATAIHPLCPTVIRDQARTIMNDMPISVFKLGVLGCLDIIHTIQLLLTEFPKIPVILDPILKAGGGSYFTTPRIVDQLKSLILPITTLITPNTIEANEIAGTADASINASVQALLATGCNYALITGGHTQSPAITNQLWAQGKLLSTLEWQRLPGAFHGTGCTLASAIAAYTAHGHDIVSACEKAQRYTWESLKHAQALGKGQLIPDRLLGLRPA